MTITNEDNMELMARYEDNYFDLAIVDPPYGLNIASTGSLGRDKFSKKNWDSETPSQEYFNELKRVSKNQIVWGWNYMTDKLPTCKGFIYWNKMNHHDNRSCGELAYTSFNKLARHFEYMWDGNRYGFNGNIQGVGQKSIRIHPTQKPVKLYEWLLMNYATCKTCKNEGGYYEDVAGDGGSQMWQVCDDCNTHERPVRILDTHLGSGSIAIACHNLGFDLTACELDKDYYEAAMKRINEHKQQLRMF